MADQPTPIDEMLDNLIVNLHALARDGSSSIYVKMQRLIDQTHTLAICVQDTRRLTVRLESAPVRTEPWATCKESTMSRTEHEGTEAWKQGVRDSMACVIYRKAVMPNHQPPAYKAALADVMIHLQAMLERGTLHATSTLDSGCPE